MEMVVSTSANTTKLTQTLSLENRNNLRDVSFSSYLNGAEETLFLLKLNESTKTQHDQVFTSKKKEEDGEIGVFGAEKYFQGEMDEENPRIGVTHHQNDKEEVKNHIVSPKPKTQLTTPSVRSESSWNSKSSLLHNNVPKKQQPVKSNKRKAQGKSFLSNLSCRCYCNNKKSVDTDDDQMVKNCGTREITKQPMRSGDFSFPVLGNPVKLEEELVETKRNSLEIFGSPVLDKGKKNSLSVDKKLTMLSWGEARENESSSYGVYHDNESDASSDLFEIESFSTNSGNPYLSRQASDAMSGCYAPSEASIEWSVATASAADFSVVSDWDEMRTATNAKLSPGKENQKRRSGVLLGCKSQKAVSVARDVYKNNDPRGPHPHRLQFDSFKPVTRFQGESKFSGYDSQRGRYASPLLYIQ